MTKFMEYLPMMKFMEYQKRMMKFMEYHFSTPDQNRMMQFMEYL